jgi:hypothetical protein
MHEDTEYAAGDFDGSTGGERIQAALDRADDDEGQSVVTVTGAGPDDGRWETTGLEIGSHTALLLRNATIRLADGAGENVLRNRDLDAGNDGISVVGVGDATIDGSAPNQPRETENHGYEDKRPEWIGLRFEKCDDLTVRDLTIERTTAWGVKCEAGDDFEAANLHFRQDDTYINQDGVHVCGPAERVRIRNLTGETWDDAAVLNVGGAVDAYGPVHGGGPIEHATIRDVRVSGHRACRVFTERGKRIHDVEIANVATWGPVVNNAVELNASYASEVPVPGDVSDVRIRNVRAAGPDQAVRVDSPATDLRIEGVTARNVSDAAVRFDRRVGDASVRDVEHRSDPAEIDRSDDDPDLESRGTATLRWTSTATAGDVVVRDVIARESAPPADRRNTVAVAEHADPELAITLDGVEIRGADRATALGGVTASIRDLHARNVVERETK